MFYFATDESPTIGILLCTSKNDTAVRLALPEGNKTIYTSKYELYLPTTEQLIHEVNEAKRLAAGNRPRLHHPSDEPPQRARHHPKGTGGAHRVFADSAERSKDAQK